MTTFLHRHPVWCHWRRSRSLSWWQIVVAAAVGLLAGLGLHRNDAGFVLGAIFLVAYVVLMPAAALVSGHQVLRGERRARRMEILQTTPLSSVAMVSGLYLTSLGMVGEWGLPLTGSALTTWLAFSHGPREVLLGCVLGGAAIVSWLCLTAVGLLLSLVSFRRQDHRVAVCGAVATVVLLFGHLVATGTEPRCFLDLLDPLCFIGATFGSPWYVDPILTWWPAAFYLLLTGVALGAASWQWANLGEGSGATVHGDPRPLNSHVKPRALRDPFLADLCNQLRRRWPRYLAITSACLLALAWVASLAEFTGPGNWLAGALAFVFVGMACSSRWASSDPAVSEPVVLTRATPWAQRQAALLRALPLVVGYILISLPAYARFQDGPVLASLSLLATIVMPVVGVLCGAAVNVVQND